MARQSVLSAPANTLELPDSELLDFIRGGSSGAEVLARLELLFPGEDGPVVDLFAEEVPAAEVPVLF